MKTSIIINPVAFRVELYKCFFWYRTFVIHGKKFISVPSSVGTDFIVSLFDVNDRDDSPGVDPRNYHRLPLVDAIYNYKFGANDCVAMRSTSPEDYYQMFFAECSIIEKEMKRFIKNENPENSKERILEDVSLIWIEGNNHPEDLGEGYSKDVLIDMNGQRKDFQIGWYDFDERKWCFHVSDTSNLDLEKMEWRSIS